MNISYVSTPNVPMHSFDEAIGLWVICCSRVEVGAEQRREVAPQLWDELAAAIRRDGGGRPESGDPPVKKRSR